MSERDELPGLADLADSALPSLPALSSALEAELGQLKPGATRKPMRQLAFVFCIAAVYGGSLIAILSLRGDIRELPIAWIASAGVAWLLGFVIPMYVALVPRSGSVVPRAQLAVGSAIVVSIAFIAMGLAIHPDGATSLHYGWDRFGDGRGCLAIGVVTAAVPIAIGAVFLRNAMPVGSRWIAAALGASGGCLGGLVLHLHCRIADAQHIGLVHGGVVGVSTLLAAAIVPRVAR